MAVTSLGRNRGAAAEGCGEARICDNYNVCVRPLHARPTGAGSTPAAPTKKGNMQSRWLGMELKTASTTGLSRGVLLLFCRHHIFPCAELLGTWLGGGWLHQDTERGEHVRHRPGDHGGHLRQGEHLLTRKLHLYRPRRGSWRRHRRPFLRP